VVLGEFSFPVPLFPQQIPHGLTWDQTPFFMVTGWLPEPWHELSIMYELVFYVLVNHNPEHLLQYIYCQSCQSSVKMPHVKYTQEE